MISNRSRNGNKNRNNQYHNSGTKLSEKMIGLLRELRWLFIGAFGLFLILSLKTHNLNDHAWSVSATQENSEIHNIAGVFGAWSSDILLYFFGNSAWWFVGLLLLLVWQDFWRFWRENDGFGVYAFLSQKFNSAYFEKLKNYAFLSVDSDEIENDRWKNRICLFSGFLLILLASCTLETLQFHSHSEDLPFTAGGLIGYEFAILLLHKFHISYTTATLLTIIVILVAWQLFSGMSWLSTFESLGGVVDKFIFKENLKNSNANLETNIETNSETNFDINENFAETEVLKTEKIEPSLFKEEVEIQQNSTSNEENFSDPFAQFKKAEKKDQNLVENLRSQENSIKNSQQNSNQNSIQNSNQNNNSFDETNNWGEATRFAAAMQQKLQQKNITNEISDENSNEISNEISNFKNIDFSNYNVPLEILDEISAKPNNVSSEQLGIMADKITNALANFGIAVTVDYAYAGPVIMSYEITPANGVKGSQIVNLEKDLARALAVQSVRVLETVPGKSCMALELPNPQRQIVQIRELLHNSNFSQLEKGLNIALGKDSKGQAIFANLSKMPHLLVAGTTGSGKSIGIHSMIFSLLFKLSPDDLRFILIDPKMLEMSIYNNIPHLLSPVVSSADDAIKILSWCVEEMENRYRIMATFGARNIQNYNQNCEQNSNSNKNRNENSLRYKKLPYIVVVIDELADLMMAVGKKAENLIARLAQKARAAGIHLILATQRPTAEIITTLIKSNIPSRIAFQVSSKADSRSIIEQSGAEALLGNGDMLYLIPGNSNALRLHGAYISENEMQQLTNYLKTTFLYNHNLENYYDKNLVDILQNNGKNSNYNDENINGMHRIKTSKKVDILLSDADLELYNNAINIVLKTRKTSATFLQKELKIDYQKMMKFLDIMEKQNIITPPNKSGVRTIVE